MIIIYPEHRNLRKTNHFKLCCAQIIQPHFSQSYLISKTIYVIMFVNDFEKAQQRSKNDTARKIL